MDGREYLAFTRKERNGILALLLILLFVIIVPSLLRNENRVVAGSEQDRNEAAMKDDLPPPHSRSVSSAAGETVVSEKRKPTNFYPRSQSNYSAHKKRRKIEPVDINEADTSRLIALPFIGSKLAARIVLFREKLGGFVEVAQLSEVYGLQDSVVQKLSPLLTCNKKLIRQLSINRSSEEELRRHPYIRWEMAKVLVRYRSMHGSFANIDDLKKIDLVEEPWVRKIQPYLDFS